MGASKAFLGSMRAVVSIVLLNLALFYGEAQAVCPTDPNIPFTRSGESGEAYELGRQDGIWVIRATVQLRYSHYFSAEELEEARGIMEQTRQWIQDYYAPYGFDLQITFDHAYFDGSSRNSYNTPKKDSFVVYIRRNTGYHMKSVYWGVNRDFDFVERAVLITHEFSHLLGLKDEYQSAIGAASPEEEASYENDSLMKNTDHPQPKLYPRHMKTILRPICT
ncbi:MAG: hypothetical protein H6626_05175 [Pseudobdellovibrionaceae bacterium]|nr:hypothetical protein [Bdellovibrionales bacterium]USN48484.1 MAG: hypothetical protein H6626_05175 [Pseudobdellovibrionaceae bacterium]